MHATFPLGRPAGIRVGAHWSVLLIMALLAEFLAQSLLPEAPGQDLVLVVEDGVLVGVVSPGDIARTLELAVLGAEAHRERPRRA